MENTAKLKCSIAWSDFKLNSDGMVPVIAQDYQTNEVLMLAYMNADKEHLDSHCCCECGYTSCSQSVIGTLEQDAADCRNGELKSHRYSDV